MDQKGVVWTWKGDVREDKSGDGLRGDGKRDWGVRGRLGSACEEYEGCEGVD